jgi:hypothetical protein
MSRAMHKFCGGRPVAAASVREERGNSSAAARRVIGGRHGFWSAKL